MGNLSTPHRAFGVNLRLCDSPWLGGASSDCDDAELLGWTSCSQKNDLWLSGTFLLLGSVLHAWDSLQNLDDFFQRQVAEKFVPTSMTFHPQHQDVFFAVLSPLGVESVLVAFLWRQVVASYALVVALATWTSFGTHTNSVLSGHSVLQNMNCSLSWSSATWCTKQHLQYRLRI